MKELTSEDCFPILKTLTIREANALYRVGN
jgi:hypothetical protein